MPSLEQRLAEIGQEFGHGFALNLSRITAVLEALGRPQDRLPPVIHVAGTNGKGSTCAFLRAIGEAAGLRVHVFTSPHLIRPNERIRVAGELVSDEAFRAALERIAATGCVVTYFEAIAAAAFLLFAETPGDLAVFEVGLGGLYDATNVLERPAVAVIAPVDLDHTALLGPDIATIAGEKAGIIKPGRPVVVGRQKPEGAAVIEARAEAHGAPLYRCGVEWDCWRANGRLLVQTEDRLLDLPPPSLFGAHQFDNAGLAAMAMLAWDPLLDETALARGIAAAEWPARMQRLTRGKLAEIAAANGSELWLDGAHNRHGAEALAVALAELEARAPRPVVLVMGMLGTKDHRSALAALAAPGRRLTAVPVRSGASLAPEALARDAAELGFEAVSSSDLPAAMMRAGGPARIVICGSLYLAGEALSL